MEISASLLEKEITKRIIIKQLTENQLPTKEQWTYLLNNPIDEILQSLLNIYLDTFKLTEYEISEKKNYYKKILSNISSK